MGGGSRELLGAVWCVPFGKDVSSTEFKLLISAVDTFCITFTAAKFLDSFGKWCGGVIFRGSLRHLAGFRTDFLSALCLTVSKLLASFWAVKLTLQIPRLKKRIKFIAEVGTRFLLVFLISILSAYTISRSLIAWLALNTDRQVHASVTILILDAWEAVFCFIIGRYIPDMKPSHAVQPVISNCVYKLTFSTAWLHWQMQFSVVQGWIRWRAQHVSV